MSEGYKNCIKNNDFRVKFKSVQNVSYYGC